jgi:hypothetical protein
MSKIENILSEDLRAWFGKGGAGGIGGGGWDRYNSSGDRVGKCGDAKEGDAYSACLSKEKARKLGKTGRASFVKRKRAAQKKGGDAKKGGERIKGQKPIKVRTGVKEIDYHSKLSRGHKPNWYQLHSSDFKPFNENFADGKKPGRKGLSKRFGISQTMSIAQLEKIAKTASGERRRMAQWNLNMKRGRKNENLDPDTFQDTGNSSPYGSGYQELEERLNLFLEKNEPTNPSKWSYYKSQAKKKFDVYPSAYANAWAAKMYKKAGGRWRKSESVLKLESKLISVSKPYEILPGDRVRNINTDCTHYRSTGKVVFVHDNGNITYQVDNRGATFTPGDQLTKSDDQLMKIFTHTPRPGYGSFSNESKLNECVVAKISFPDTTVLAKNRDRGYKAEIEVIHEIINGVEVVYLHDRLTDWSEGMNEFGIGIINASLTVDFDEKEGDLAKQNIEKGKAPSVSYDGLKIRTALASKKLSEAVKSVVSFVGEDSKDVGVKGMTIIANPKHSFLIEMTSKHAPIIKKIDSEKVVVRTNHGIAYTDTGYTSGVRRKSSESRMKIATEKLNNVSGPTEVLDTLSKQYTKDNFLNPYRRSNKYDMETTSQVMYDLNKLEFTLRWDIDHSEFKGIVSHLPSKYQPKIKIIVSETD